MNSKDIIYNFQLQIFEIFKSQDPDLFDTVFEIDGKKVYAHKYLLISISPTFMAMLSDRWNPNKNDAIKIKDYKFEDFKELLTFIYSGKCDITDVNIFTMIDMAEFYQIKHLKEICEQFLLKMQIDLGNIFQLIKISSRYSITQMKQPIQTYISDNFTSFVECDTFLNSNESFIIDLLDYIKKPETVFEIVLKWSENQAIKKQKESNEENLNLNDAIKNEISPFLQYIDFKKMNRDSLKSITKMRYLFSPKKFDEILEYANSDYKIIIKNANSQSISGVLPSNSEAAEIIKSLKKLQSNYFIITHSVWWSTKCQIPSTPSLMKKRDDIEWYLIYFSTGQIGVRRSSDIIEADYLLAEMTTDSTGFQVTTKCKITIE